jgi:hydrogenase/urease accessory protein HupE
VSHLARGTLHVACRVAAIVAAALVFCPLPAQAHDPGLSSLELRAGANRVVATLSVAAADARRVADGAGSGLAALALDAIEVRLDGAVVRAAVDSWSVEGATGTTVVLAFPVGKARRLSVRSLVPARLALGHRQLLTVRGANGDTLSERMLDARGESVDVDLAALPGSSSAGEDFFQLGVRHILSGYDHLLFLAALLLGVARAGQVVKTITAFTIAHSTTLAAAVFGVVRVPSVVIEPLIAASIIFVGAENLVRGQMDARWKLTFVFGLVHGFGFAGALQDLGIGGRSLDIARALGLFNLGVEAGQIGVAMLLWPVVRRLTQRPLLNVRLAPACSWGVVVAGLYWLLERTVGGGMF